MTLLGVTANVSPGSSATTVTVTAYHYGHDIDGVPGAVTPEEPLVVPVGDVDGVPHVVVVTLTPAEDP
jgi:hypothetical protein